MKKILTFSAALILLAGFVLGQAPQKFNYQAVARNSDGSLIANQTVAIRLSILDGSIYGASLYVEVHHPVTNQFGLFTVNVGGGTVEYGLFGAIQWDSNTKFLKVEMDANNGSSYTLMGTTQLLSVPYALYAEKSGSTLAAGDGIAIENDTISNTAPDFTVTLTGAGATTVQGAYPDFIISSTDNNTTYTAGVGLQLTGTQFSALNNSPIWNANRLQTKPISTTAPTTGQYLMWDGTNWKPAECGPKFIEPVIIVESYGSYGYSLVNVSALVPANTKVIILETRFNDNALYIRESSLYNPYEYYKYGMGDNTIQISQPVTSNKEFEYKTMLFGGGVSLRIRLIGYY